ncbi:MAG: hypothetical protein PSY14_11520 [bacterium]|nr:hypothetical protein [bacterium]
MKKLWIALLIAGILYVVISPSIFPHRLTPLTSHIREPDTYFFHMGFPKDLSLAVVKGSNCGELKGNYTMDTRRRGGARGDQARWVRDWTQLLGREPPRVEEWKNEDHKFDLKWACLPNVSSIADYLRNPDAEVDWNAITLKDGPILVAQGAPVTTREMKINDVFDCTKNPHVFCARASVNSKQKKYRVICWKCEKLKSSAGSLQRAILSRSLTGGLNHGEEFSLDGGYMISEDSFGPKNTGFIGPSKYENSIFDTEKSAGDYARSRLQRILRLIESDKQPPH